MLHFLLKVHRHGDRNDEGDPNTPALINVPPLGIGQLTLVIRILTGVLLINSFHN